MKLVGGDDRLDWRLSFALIAVAVLIEVTVFAVLATHDIPNNRSPDPRILTATAKPTRQGTELQVQAQDPDAVLSRLQIDWGDGHRQTLARGCTTATGTPLYGGETYVVTTKHPHNATRVHVRPTSRSCFQRQPTTTGRWMTAETLGG